MVGNIFIILETLEQVIILIFQLKNYKMFKILINNEIIETHIFNYTELNNCLKFN